MTDAGGETRRRDERREPNARSGGGALGRLALREHACHALDRARVVAERRDEHAADLGGIVEVIDAA